MRALAPDHLLLRRLARAQRPVAALRAKTRLLPPLPLPAQVRWLAAVPQDEAPQLEAKAPAAVPMPPVALLPSVPQVAGYPEEAQPSEAGPPVVAKPWVAALRAAERPPAQARQERKRAQGARQGVGPASGRAWRRGRAQGPARARAPQLQCRAAAAGRDSVSDSGQANCAGGSVSKSANAWPRRPRPGCGRA